jgi:hypothetical protein
MTIAPPTVRCRVSVVICAYTEDRWSRLVAAIESVRAQTCPAEEVVLVIDHCPPLAARARSEFTDVVVTENSSAQGLSGARNVGLQTATGDVVAFIDDDAAAEPDWLDHLTQSYEDEDVIGVGGHVEPDFSTDRPGWFPPEFDWVIGCSHAGMPSFARPVRNFVGANMSFRREALVDLGGFSQSLGRVGANAAGCEETELCIRAADWKPGGRLVYVPEARVDHYVPPGRTTCRYFLRRCYAEGRSKAVVATLAGHQRGLEDERTYLRSTVPKGIARSLWAVIAGDPAGLLRAATAIGGVASTSLGYVRAQPWPRMLRLPGRRGPRPGADTEFDTADQVSPPARSTTNRIGMAMLALVFVVWVLALRSTKPLDTMTDYGLLSVLPATFWVALGLLTASFFWLVRRAEASRLLIVGHVVLLVLIFHATPAILYGTLRYSWAWKHIGITQYIIAHHQINLHLHSNPELVAYQDWPGFFAFNALLSSAAKLFSPLSYASWGPAASQLLSLGPLVLIFRRFTQNRRVVWTAVWLFYLGNWVGQDYYSPQAFAYFLYLAIIAVCLSRFARRWVAKAPGQTPVPIALGPSGALAGPASPRPSSTLRRLDQRVGSWLSRRETWILYVVVALAIGAIASSHQLTPFILVSALILLALSRHLRYRSLPFVAMVLAVGWIAFAAETFLSQNLASIIKSIGHPLGNTTSTLVNLQQASAGQLVIAKIDRLLTVALILLAILGWWRSRRQPGGRRRWRPALLLMAAPLAALAGNNYGGEIGFRVYLFALPFFALFAATAIEPRTNRIRGKILELIRPLLAGVLLVGFLFAYYGKERMNYFPPDEVTTMTQLYRTAPPGSLLLGATSNLPWAFEHYNAYTYDWYTADDPATIRRIIANPVTNFAREMARYKHAYLIFSSTDAAEVEMTGLMPRGALPHLEQEVLASGQFRVAMRTSHITILTLVRHAPT